MGVNLAKILEAWVTAFGAEHLRIAEYRIGVG